jgi:hypothetical protein
MTTEIWKDIVGLEGYYQVSDLGRVRSVDREFVDRRGHNRRFPGVMIVITDDGAGYQKFLSHKAGVKKNISLHVCVLQAFTGSAPEGFECCHGNGDRKDNRHSNLRWGTRAENAKDRALHGTAIRGEESPNSKLSDRDVREILRSPESHAEVASVYGVSAELVGMIRNGKAWSHLDRSQVAYRKRQATWMVQGRPYKTLKEAADAENIVAHVLRYRCQGRKSKGRTYPPSPGYGFVETNSGEAKP